jgi:hypothetical protein
MVIYDRVKHPAGFFRRFVWRLRTALGSVT